MTEVCTVLTRRPGWEWRTDRRSGRPPCCRLFFDRAPLERELTEIERKLKMISAPLEARRSEIQARLVVAAAPSVIQLHQAIEDRERRGGAHVNYAN